MKYGVHRFYDLLSMKVFVFVYKFERNKQDGSKTGEKRDCQRDKR